MNKVVVCVVAGLVSAAVFASDWYVDAVNGNNDWDGTTGSETVVSETSDEAFSYTLDGACTVQSLSGSGTCGLILMVR